MNIFEAIFQGLIQGFTEFLPVSSSGHLSLFQHFFGLSGDGALLISIVLHLGTLLAVFIAFRKTIGGLILEFFRMIKDIFTGKFKWKTMNAQRRMIMMIIISILPLFAFYLLKDYVSALSTDNDIIIEGMAFLYTSAILFISDRCAKGTKTAAETTVKDSLAVGIFQGIALVPGISRSGSTISAGLMRGFSREYAVEYSFILGIPVILASALVEFKDTFSEKVEVEWLPLILGFAVSAVAGFFAIKLIKWLVKTDKFKIFAYYTLVLGIIVIAIGIFEHINGMTIVQFFSK
ncbi:MAG: undecaprenyl-diphosphate phosphatase [Oscillospiraceae bacterium]